MLGLTELVDVTHGVIFPLLGQVDDLADRDSVTGDLMRGSVTIHGQSRAIVTVDCSTRLARLLGAAMFDTPENELSQEEVDDALGEIANIIGGNIKALLPGPSELGLPEIDYNVVDRPSQTVVEQAFRCTGEPFRVCVAAR
jgi:chemotaxis protein CheX